METDLEKYIKNHRESLDLAQPDPENWEKIRQKRIPTKKNYHFWKIAATILLLTTIALSLLLIRQQTSESSLASLEDMGPEYKEMEQQYKKDINFLAAEIDYSLLEKRNYDWMLQELESLDNVNKVFRKDINKTANREKLIDILIDHYEKKIKLLRRLELETKRIKNESDNDKTS